MSDIIIWNRAAGREEVERVYGGGGINWLYGTRLGRWISDLLLSRRFPSWLYGFYQQSGWSRRKVRPFISKFQIPMEEYENPGFHSFNDFFIRKFKGGSRSFVGAPGAMAAFAEARYLAFEKISGDLRFPVKGDWLSAAALLGDAERARPFFGGSLLLARLCPTDYHRFHYPDDGQTVQAYPIHGGLHSVNPLALHYRGRIFATNERRVSILRTKNFGLLAYIEVGAMMVGKIVQSHAEDQPFRRGEEKGYFLFGGSTVIVLGEAGAWTPDADLLEKTSHRVETLVKLGERVAAAVTPVF